MTASAVLANALALAEHGWAVLPVHGPVDGHCDCRWAQGCNSPAKHPMTASGLKDATTDPELIARWWDQWPTANLGLVIPDGYLAVDVDTEDVARVLGDRILPPTATVRTARGWHYLYRSAVPVRPKVAVLPRVDIRGQGSYIVAPPSRHVSGAVYVWTTPPGGGIADAPDWLVELATAGTTALAAPDAADEPIPEGGRNAALASLAGTMRRRGASSLAIGAALLAENEARCRPPLPEAEVATIARSVARYAPADAPAELILDDEPIERPHARPAAGIDPADAEHDVPLIEGVLRRGRFMLLAATEGVGKSYARLEMAARLATGTGPLFGHYPIPAAVRVLLVDVENGDAEETRREEDVLDALGLSRASLVDYWRVSLEGLSLTDPADQAYVRAEIAAARPEVVVFDTGSSMVGEEWGRELKAAVRFLRGLARVEGCAVIVCAHLTKPNRQGPRPKDAPEHGESLADVMGQWTRQADSVALMAPAGAGRVRWSMRKRVPHSTLILAAVRGVFNVVQVVDEADDGVMTRDRVLRAIVAGETEAPAIAAALGVAKRTVWRCVKSLRDAGELAPDAPLRVAQAGTPPVTAQMAHPGTPDGTPEPVGSVPLALPTPIRGSAGGTPTGMAHDDANGAAFAAFLADSAGKGWERVR